jgi:flagellar biosynthetic protein FlhB
VAENKPLARALYAETEVGDYVPERYLRIIADILAHVYSLDEERRRKIGWGA